MKKTVILLILLISPCALFSKSNQSSSGEKHSRHRIFIGGDMSPIGSFVRTQTSNSYLAGMYIGVETRIPIKYLNIINSFNISYMNLSNTHLFNSINPYSTEKGMRYTYEGGLRSYLGTKYAYADVALQLGLQHSLDQKSIMPVFGLVLGIGVMVPFNDFIGWQTELSGKFDITATLLNVSTGLQFRL